MKEAKTVEGPITLYSPVHRGGTKDLDNLIGALKKNKKASHIKAQATAEEPQFQIHSNSVCLRENTNHLCSGRRGYARRMSNHY